MKLVIEIDLNNDAMRNNRQVKDCLLSSRLIGQTGCEDYAEDEHGSLKDSNGNVIGNWWIELHSMG